MANDNMISLMKSVHDKINITATGKEDVSALTTVKLSDYAPYSNIVYDSAPRSHYEKIEVPHPTRCKYCGAHMTSYVCEYCETEYPKFESVYVK